MDRTGWEALDEAVRRAVTIRFGTIRAARDATEGYQSQVAALLETGTGSVFLKGIRTDHRAVVRQGREAMINPVVLPVAPALIWQAQVAGWDLLAFEAITGARHADYAPGTADLPLVVEAMNRLGRIPCPDLPVKLATQRWAEWLDHPGQAELLDGDRLLHTDFNPLNVLITDDAAWIIDWAWPTRGARFIDPACFAVRLIGSGQSPEDAERWAACCDGWSDADPRAVDLFVTINARMFRDIARQEHAPWKGKLASAAASWDQYRTARAERETVS